MALIYIGIGSNEGNRFAILQEAILQLKRNLGVFLQNSSLYETEPWGFDSNQSFYNGVLKFETEHGPKEVLNILQYIEKQAGRKQKSSAGYEDRTLDLDLLYYDNQLIQEEGLVVPHPKISERNFVLFPMAEIDADFVDPAHQKTIRLLIQESNDTSAVEKIDLNIH